MQPKSHFHWIDKLAIVNGLISGIALYPQVYQAVTSSNFEGFSGFTYGIILFNSVVWLAYSIHRRLISLFISSALNAIAAFILLLVVY